MSVATVNILGLPVGAFTMASLLARLQELLAAPGCATAYGINAYVLNLIYQHPDYLAGLLRADCLYADGASLRLAARVLGGRIPEKLTTTDLWPHLCELAVARGYRFFLLGGEPGLAERARDRALQQYPQLQIVGVYHGLFRDRRCIGDRRHQCGPARHPLGGDGRPPPGAVDRKMAAAFAGRSGAHLRRHVQDRGGGTGAAAGALAPPRL